jgi:hypothetical protein
MANKFQFKRTTVSGRTANTTNISNSAFIDKGEFAVNLTDRKVFSSDAANAIFEVGSNLSSLAVTTIVANGSSGTDGQVLTSNGTGVYWAEGGGGGSSNLYASIATYTYSISANTTIITGADDETLVLSYTAGLESVYLNGSKQIVDTDYLASNTTAITFTSNLISGDVVQVVAQIAVPDLIEGTSNSRTTSTTANNIVDSFAKETYRSAKYYIQITSGTDYHVTEALILHDDSEVYVVEYGTIFSNTSLGNVSANINSSNVNLLVAPTNSSSVIKTKRITLDV